LQKPDYDIIFSDFTHLYIREALKRRTNKQLSLPAYLVYSFKKDVKSLKTTKTETLANAKTKKPAKTNVWIRFSIAEIISWRNRDEIKKIYEEQDLKNDYSGRESLLLSTLDNNLEFVDEIVVDRFQKHATFIQIKSCLKRDSFTALVKFLNQETHHFKKDDFLKKLGKIYLLLTLKSQ